MVDLVRLSHQIVPAFFPETWPGDRPSGLRWGHQGAARNAVKCILKASPGPQSHLTVCLLPKYPIVHCIVHGPGFGNDAASHIFFFSCGSRCGQATGRWRPDLRASTVVQFPEEGISDGHRQLDHWGG